MSVFETDRLVLRELTTDDAAFAFELVNDADWIRYIGDRGVRTLDDARAYLEKGPIAMVRREGFGLWMVERRVDRAPLGMCGLLRRDWLPDVDIGFAFLPSHRRHGYAFEAADATLRHARDVLKLHRVVALTSLDNAPSQRLLEKLGLKLEGRRPFAGTSEEVCCFAIEW